MKKKILIVLAAFIVLVTASAFYITRMNRNNTPASNNGDSETAKNYVEGLAKNISLNDTPAYTKSFDEGCETSPAGSGLDSKTDKRCAFRHISVYTVPDYATLNELKAKILSDNWTGEGQNVIMDTEYFRNNGATYYRYDGPLSKQSTVSVDYFGNDSKRKIDDDINLASSYDSGKLESLTTVKQKLVELASPLIVVDVKYEYLWSLN
jgi:hypothetical protein